MKAITVKQPRAALIMSGRKDVENRTWRVPSTLPQWWTCGFCCLLTRRHHRYTYETRYHVHQGRRFEVNGHDGPFPFRLGIHAAKTFAACGAEPWDALRRAHDGDRNPGDVSRGALLGFVTVTGCHHADECYSKGHYPSNAVCNCGPGGMNGMHESGCGLDPFCSLWAEPDVYHWTLADPEPFVRPVPMKGMLGLWTLPSEVAA